MEKKDFLGHKLDFHTLRATYTSLLNMQGITLRAAMELLRHSDMKLTHKVYADSSALPLASEVNKLPAL
ncbi:MAG: hypothetical protein LBV12_07520 [Puniceicoccales bacterium]|nr:hypothetical protein [Puniceicoccales bacterium]